VNGQNARRLAAGQGWRDDSVNKQADKPTDKTEGRQQERQGGVRCLTLMLQDEDRQPVRKEASKQGTPDQPPESEAPAR
jgi:hypothetical protein